MYYTLAASSMESPFAFSELAIFSFQLLFEKLQYSFVEVDPDFILKCIQSLLLLTDKLSFDAVSNLESVINQLEMKNFSYPIQDSKFVISLAWNHAVELYYRKSLAESRNWISLAIKLQTLLLKDTYLQQREMMIVALNELKET
jgi:hypothetical protein